jgi:hypothetical protein
MPATPSPAMGLDKSRLARPICPGPHHSSVAVLMAVPRGLLLALRSPTAQAQLAWKVELMMQEEELEPR